MFSALLKKSKYPVMIIIIVLSFAIRLGVGWDTLHVEPQSDETIFTRLGWNLVSGKGYSMNGETASARRSPGYPLVLAGIIAIFGKNWAAVRVVNILYSSLTAGMIYLIGYSLFNEKVGLIAGLISVFYPVFVRISLKMIAYSQYIFLVCLMLLLFIKIDNRPGASGLKLFCGVVLGVTILTRSEFLIFIPLLFIWAFLFYRQFYVALRSFMLILLPALLFIVPWFTRNYIVFGELLMATNMGPVMLGVHSPVNFTNLDLMGKWHQPDINFRNAGEDPQSLHDPAYRYLPEQEWNRLQLEMALESIRQNIRQLPRMELYKLHELIFTPGQIRDLIRLPLLYCFLFGLILLLASGNRRFLIFYMLIILAVISTLIFYTGEKLRMVMDPVFIVFASYGLSEQIKLVNQVRANRNTTKVTAGFGHQQSTFVAQSSEIYDIHPMLIDKYQVTSWILKRYLCRIGLVTKK